LTAYGYDEFIPDGYSMEEVSSYFSKAESIVSVHGSGLSNLPFISEGAKVLDIMAPFHQDPYYWMITNQRKAKYVALFAEGDHPADELDLVKNKVDNDLLIDLDKFRNALDLIA
jgi:capsular polysaccharide biosynthesis protein